MIASKIGRTLLNAYNEKKGTHYTAKEFFELVFFPLFYDHEKYMQWITNSPFVQGLEGFGNEYADFDFVKDNNDKSLKFSKEEKSEFIEIIKNLQNQFKERLIGFKIKVGSGFQIYDSNKIDNYFTKGIDALKIAIKLDAIQRREKLYDFTNKVDKTIKPDGSIVIGYPASGELETTSGQVTNIDIPFSQEITYLSWIGSGCGIGIGGLSIYIDNPQILLYLLDGWQLYRNEFLNKFEKIEGNKVDTWNGQWLSHRLSFDFDERKPLVGFNSLEADKQGYLSFSVQNWLKVLFAFANNFKGNRITIYVFSLGKTNKTVGFIPINLPQIRRPIDLYKKIFGVNEYLSNAKIIEEIYGNPKGFLRACEMGAIGIQALKPQDLEGYVFPDKEGNLKYPDLTTSKIRKPKKDESADDYNKYIIDTNFKNKLKPIKFNVYITWIISMLNENETLWEKADKYAQSLKDYEDSDKALSTKRKNEVEKVLAIPYKRQFIEALIPLLNEGKVDGNLIHQLAEEADKTPKDNFAYFLTLIRFKYAYLKNISKPSKS